MLQKRKCLRLFVKLCWSETHVVSLGTHCESEKSGRGRELIITIVDIAFDPLFTISWYWKYIANYRAVPLFPFVHTESFHSHVEHSTWCESFSNWFNNIKLSFFAMKFKHVLKSKLFQNDISGQKSDCWIIKLAWKAWNTLPWLCNWVWKGTFLILERIWTAVMNSWRPYNRQVY